MGIKNRAGEAEAEACLSEALLFATMCIIGLPVDVHIRDGSVYSGTFHTASVDKDYGIVLKEARLTKKGKCEANVANGRVIETLVILSDDLVQVVAKGVQLPANGVTGTLAGNDVEAALTNVPSSEMVASEAKKVNKSTMDKRKINQNRGSGKHKNGYVHAFKPTKSGNEQEDRNVPPNHIRNVTEVENGNADGVDFLKSEDAFAVSLNERQIGDSCPQGRPDHDKQSSEREKSAGEVQSSSCISSSFLGELKEIAEEQSEMKQPNRLSPDLTPALINEENGCRPASAGTSPPNAVCSGVPTVYNPVASVASETRSSSAASSDVASPQNPESTKSSKEFKLNPGARIFSPSFVNSSSATTPVVPTVAMAYLPSNSPMVPVASVQQDAAVGPFASRSPAPTKFAPYNGLTTGNGGSSSQFSQPIVEHTGNRTPPLRFPGQYHAVQAAPSYMPPHSQAVMVGRPGQLVYLQPFPHDLVQTTEAVSPIPMHPVVSPQQAQYPKHQGSATGQALQLCMLPPFVAGGQQPFAMPSPIPLLQPSIPANQPIGVPGSNALFSTKFP